LPWNQIQIVPHYACEGAIMITLTSTACRKARLALNWSIRDLKAKSAVSIGSISRFERGAKLKNRTLNDIKRAFAAEGIVFKN
jgi:transcriptional regulator with XRE-family HTH domain